MSSSSQVSKIILLFPNQYLAVPTFSNEGRPEGRLKLQTIYTFIIHICSFILIIKGLLCVRHYTKCRGCTEEHIEAYLLETYLNEQVRLKKDLQLAYPYPYENMLLQFLKNKTKTKKQTTVL